METKLIKPYSSVPYIPLNEVELESRHGANFFSNVKQLSVGYGSRVFRVDRDGMWAGAETFAAAPWSVDWDGNMIANSITISGYIPTGGALSDIGTGGITETYIGSNAITTAKIAANAITASQIQANAVTASKISVSSLSAISANIGTVTSGTITGALIRTSSSGDRVELDDGDDAIRIYDTSGVKRMELIHDTLNFYTDAGNNAGIIYAVDSGSYEYLFFDISNNSDGSFLFNIDNSGIFVIAEDANVRVSYVASGNDLIIDDVVDTAMGDLFCDDIDALDITCVTLTETSDERLKKNVKGLNYGLADLNKLRPVQYQYKQLPDKKPLPEQMESRQKELKKGFKMPKPKRKQRAAERSGDKHLGFLAQEVYQVMPELTKFADDPEKTARLFPTQMIPVLVKGIQELSDQVTVLQDEVKTLRGG